jgi:epoxide hydrolase-like predicted phosphatase
VTTVNRYHPEVLEDVDPAATEGVVFDMGGILHPTPFEVLPEVARAKGWPRDVVPEGPFAPDGDQDYGRLDRGEIREPQYWQAVSERLARKGLAFDIHEVIDWQGRDRVEVVEAIRRLAGRYRMGLLTNDATDWLGPGWRHTWWLRDAFSVMVDAAEEGLRKPAPEIYLRCAERLGVAPARIVFVDDLTVNVEGARAVGMQAFWFDVTDARGSLRRLLELLLPDEVESVLGRLKEAG